MAEPFTHTMRVRYVECDALGVVFNAHYLTYLDQTMTELFRAAVGGYRRLIESELDMVVADVHMRFHAPARFDDEILLEATVAHIGTTSLITHHRIRREQELLLDAEMVHVWVRRGSALKTPVPDWARDGLRPWSGHGLQPQSDHHGLQPRSDHGLQPRSDHGLQPRSDHGLQPR